MKLLTSLRFALCGAAIVLTHSAFAAKPPPPPPLQLDNWLTVDAAQNAINYGLTVAPNGVIHAQARRL
jgi:hypothetical protein